MDNDIKRFLIWLIAAVIIIGSFLTIIFLSKGGSGKNTSGILSVALSQNEWIKGNKDAKVTLVEYSDFQCPACKSREPILQKLMSEFGNHIRFVYRHFPLRSIHNNAQISGQAGEAAGLQGKFWEMHDLIFENQAIWEEQNTDEAQQTFTTYAGTLGLNVEKFKEDIASGDVKKAVNDDYDSGEDSGVDATPTFFLNNQKINPASYEEFRSLVRQAVESAS